MPVSCWIHCNLKCFRFMFLVHVNLISVQGDKHGSNFIFLHMDIPFPQSLLLQMLHFLQCIFFCLFLNYQMTVVTSPHFWLFYFILLACTTVFMSVLCCFYYYRSIMYLKSGMETPQGSSLLPRIALVSCVFSAAISILGFLSLCL